MKILSRAAQVSVFRVHTWKWNPIYWQNQTTCSRRLKLSKLSSRHPSILLHLASLIPTSLGKATRASCLQHRTRKLRKRTSRRNSKCQMSLRFSRRASFVSSISNRWDKRSPTSMTEMPRLMLTTVTSAYWIKMSAIYLSSRESRTTSWLSRDTT